MLLNFSLSAEGSVSFEIPQAGTVPPPLKSNLLLFNTNLISFLSLIAIMWHEQDRSQKPAYLVTLVVNSCVILGQSIFLKLWFTYLWKLDDNICIYVHKVIKCPMLKTCHSGLPFFTTLNLLTNFTFSTLRMKKGSSLPSPRPYNGLLTKVRMSRLSSLSTTLHCASRVQVKVCVLLTSQTTTSPPPNEILVQAVQLLSPTSCTSPSLGLKSLWVMKNVTNGCLLPTKVMWNCQSGYSHGSKPTLYVPTSYSQQRT